MNDNKHKVAFCFALVILMVTLRRCHGSGDVAEVVSHSARALPANTIAITSLDELKRSYATKSTAEKLVEIRGLLRSLLFDWSLGGESTIAGRTFGRLRQIRQIMLPAVFLAGFLTAVIMGIKIIGVINMLLITGVLVLNLAVILGKLFFAKPDKFGHNGHHGPPYHHHSPPFYGSNSYSFADNRADSSLPFQRNFNSPSFPMPPAFGPNFNQPAFPNQIPQGLNQPQPTFPQTFNQPSITPQQPPTNFQPQPQNSPFSGIQMQAPQPQNSPFNGIQMQAPQPQSSPFSDIQMQAPQQVPTMPMISQFGSQMLDSRMNDGMQPVLTTPSTEIEKINLQELPTTVSPLDILNDALARMGEKMASGEPLKPLVRFKRKPQSHQRRHLSSSKPFS